MEIKYTVKIHPAEEGGYWAEVPALPGCFTQGETFEEITAMAKEAIELYIEDLVHEGKSLPREKNTKKDFAFPISVRVPKSA